jgi:Icc-related predicted phosphoesterase
MIEEPMKLLIFSDLHNDARALEKLMDIEADYYIAAGDLVSCRKGLDKMAGILERRAHRMYVMPGNHETVDDMTGLCTRYGFHSLHDTAIECGEYHVAGLGYSNITPFDTPGEYPEAEIALRLAKYAALKPLVLICHAPPHQTALDRVSEGLHAGSPAVRDFIERYQPPYFFCGHIHEAEGVVIQMGATRAQNVGKPGYLLEL